MHYTFGTKEELYRAVMERLTEDLVAQVERATPEDSGFEATVAALAAALWRTVGEQPTSHQLLNELSMFALPPPERGPARPLRRDRTAVQALVSAVVALAGGRLDLVTVPTA